MGVESHATQRHQSSPPAWQTEQPLPERRSDESEFGHLAAKVRVEVQARWQLTLIPDCENFGSAMRGREAAQGAIYIQTRLFTARDQLCRSPPRTPNNAFDLLQDNPKRFYRPQQRQSKLLNACALNRAPEERQWLTSWCVCSW